MVGIDRAGLAAGRATFVVADALAAGVTITLGEQAARHMRVLRLDTGAIVGLRDGRGGVAEGGVVRLAKNAAQVEVREVEQHAPPPPVHLLVPVADRDRMLWLVEKAAELGCTSWRPVLWHRSRSVSPRGEGITFQAKLRARMESALAQSEGTWLPQLFPAASPERAILATPAGDRLLLDPDGAPMAGAGSSFTAPVTIALGPEGGFEAAEVEMLRAAGFRPSRIGGGILRFETAGIAALAIVRSVLPRQQETIDE